MPEFVWWIGVLWGAYSACLHDHLKKKIKKKNSWWPRVLVTYSINIRNLHKRSLVSAEVYTIMREPNVITILAISKGFSLRLTVSQKMRGLFLYITLSNSFRASDAAWDLKKIHWEPCLRCHRQGVHVAVYSVSNFCNRFILPRSLSSCVVDCNEEGFLICAVSMASFLSPVEISCLRNCDNLNLV